MHTMLLAALFLLGTAQLPARPDDERTQHLHVPPSKFVKADSTYIRISPENGSLRLRMASSPLPVSIRQQGRQLCVKSKQSQVLPVYTGSGTFYATFRLTKGTNWISGLPRGTYYINGNTYNIF